MEIILYEYLPTRSQRVRWALQELDLPFESVEGRDLIGSDKLRNVHPQAKVPAVTIDGKPLFESAAICTFLADATPQKGLISASGTWERAQHDQWSYFALTEVEAWMWHSARHTFMYPEDKRIPDVIAPNGREATRGLRVFNDALGKSDFLVGNAFSITDVIAGFTLNWARRTGLTGDLANVDAYLDRLYERPHCTLAKPD